MAEKHPYYRRQFIYACALIEFDNFLRKAAAIVEQEVGHIPRAGPLRNAHGFLVNPSIINSLFRFGLGPGRQVVKEFPRQKIRRGMQVRSGQLFCTALAREVRPPSFCTQPNLI